MKKIFFLLLTFLSIGQWSPAQTKLIAHKSHSGSNAHFSMALNNPLFDLGDSNFGMAPTDLIQSAILDSLIHLTDSTVLMITSQVCNRQGSEAPNIWKAGKDTLLHHPLFSLKNNLDSIKKNLEANYSFNNPVDSITFIGYGNQEIQKTKKERAPKKRKEKKAAKQKKTPKDLIKVQLQQDQQLSKTKSVPNEKRVLAMTDAPIFSDYSRWILVSCVGFCALLVGFLGNRFGF